MTSKHERRVALVTGASKGIGRATALRLARDGFDVAVNYHSDDAGAKDAAREIESLGAAAITVHGDVSDPEDVAAVTSMTLEQLGRIDVLVNNAAIFPWREWTEITVEEWDRVLAVNLRGCFLMARACVPDMQRRGWGRVISLSSATHLTGATHLMHYASSKAAIVAFSRSLAQVVGEDGITVNSVTTGRTHTEGFQAWFDQGVLDYDETVESRQHQCIKRLADPEDIVGTIAFLASDDAAYMTGQLLNVDGGRNFL